MAYFLTLLYVLFSYLRPAEQFPNLASYRIMLWLGLVAGLGAAYVYVVRGRWWFKSREVLLVTVFTGSIVASRVVNGWLGGALSALGDFGMTAAVFFCIVVTVNSVRRLRILVAAIILALLIIIGQAFVAYYTGYQEDIYIISQKVEAPNALEIGMSQSNARQELKRIRGLGFLNDPNDLGQALVMTLPFVALAWRRGHRFRNLVQVLIPVGLFLAAIYLTHSRGAIISLLVLVLFAARKKLGNVRAGLAGVLFITLALAANVAGGRAVSSNDESGEGRLEAWSDGLQMLRSHPVFGVGYNAFTANRDLTAHNSFVLCFSELGLAGYFVWLLLLGVSHEELRSLDSNELARQSDVRRLAQAMRISLYSFLAAAFFLSRTYNVGLYILLGMIAALTEIAAVQRLSIRFPRLSSVAGRTVAVEIASIALIYGLMRVRHI